MRTMEDLIACLKKRIDQLNKDIKAVSAITYDRLLGLCPTSPNANNMAKCSKSRFIARIIATV